MNCESEEDLLEELVEATAAHDIRSVEQIIQAGIDPSTPSKSNGCSALHTAAVLESPAGPEIVSRMLYHGANPNIKTPTGLSPLHIAAMWGRYETINVLLDNGADVAVKDSDDMSALDFAEEAEKNKAQCIDALTRYRCNTKHTSGGFKCKTRLNLEKILGGHVEFSTFLSDDSINESTNSVSNKHLNLNDSFLSDVTNIENIDDDKSMNQTLNGTLFQTCNESFPNMVTSTFIEGPADSDTGVTEQATTSHGYLGDTSSITSSKESTTTSSSTSGESADETFWSVRNSFVYSSEQEGNVWVRDETLPPIRRRKNKNKYFIPLSPSPLSMQTECNINTEEQMVADEQSTECLEEKEEFLEEKAGSINDKDEKKERFSQDDEGFLEETPELHTLNTPEKESLEGEEDKEEEDEMIENMSNLLLSGKVEEIIDFAAEETVNYSNNTSVSLLIDYFEGQDDPEDELNPFETTLSESPSKSLKSSHFVMIKCREEVPQHQRRSLDELSSITVSYDWKDVSQILDKTVCDVTPSVLSLTNLELRDRLISMGEKPGPITDTTRRVYQKYLTKIETVGDQKSKKENKFTDYTHEMRQVLMGITTLLKEKGDDLEQEMSFIFENPEKHTWREGTQKTSFNYILIDPRVTKNLADRFGNMSFMEQFQIFVSAIFYVGKGKKSRPYEHFHEAVKYLKNENKNTKSSTKVNMILDIWEQGYGVTTLHVFHSVIPVEAYTREACMIETLGLPRLTNVKQGDFYGPAASWGVKKKRLLGIHLLMKAMRIYLIEGERQIKQRDLTK